MLLWLGSASMKIEFATMNWVVLGSPLELALIMAYDQTFSSVTYPAASASGSPGRWNFAGDPALAGTPPTTSIFPVPVMVCPPPEATSA